MAWFTTGSLALAVAGLAFLILRPGRSRDGSDGVALGGVAMLGLLAFALIAFTWFGIRNDRPALVRWPFYLTVGIAIVGALYWLNLRMSGGTKVGPEDYSNH